MGRRRGMSDERHSTPVSQVVLGVDMLVGAGEWVDNVDNDNRSYYHCRRRYRSRKPLRKDDERAPPSFNLVSSYLEPAFAFIVISRS